MGQESTVYKRHKIVLRKFHCSMLSPLSFLSAASLLSLALSASVFPEYRSLAGLSHEEVRAIARTFHDTPGAQPLPPAINDTSPKLVFDEAHPWLPPGPGDIRGPCPGLNTLASHGVCTFCFFQERSRVLTDHSISTAPGL